jgi:hypothetical protein
MSGGTGVHFATLHPEDGRALRYHFDEFMLSWIRSVVARLSRRPAWSVASKHLGAAEVALYVEQLLGLELTSVGRGIFQAQFAAKQGRLAEGVFAPRTLAGLLSEDAAKLGVRVVPSRLLDLQRRYLGLRRTVRQAVLRRRSDRPQPSAVGATIAVELVEGADPARKSDAFWLASGEIDPRRVLFVLEGQNRTLVNIEQNIDAIHRIGARVVAVDPLMARGGVPYWQPRTQPPWVRELADELGAPQDGVDQWLLYAIRSFSRRVAHWESFFLEHHVRVVQNFTEFSPETIAKRVAIGRLGGIELGKLRSQFFEGASAAFCFRHEVAFLWHRNAIPFLRTGYTGTEYAIETGYVYDYLIQNLQAEGAALRQKLAAQGITTVVCAFDNQTHPFTHSTAEHLTDFYETVLSLAEDRPTVGLIVKSKKPGIIPTTGGIVDRLNALVRVGRCVVIDQPLISVLPAALASDLALCVPTSTAACEAALAGCRVAMYDPSGSRGHPWSKAGDIFFRDLDAFRAGCIRELEMISRGTRGVSRERLLELDPYLDGKASHRAATFINAFVTAREKGLDKRSSLAEAMAGSAEHAVSVDAESRT